MISPVLIIVNSVAGINYAVIKSLTWAGLVSLYLINNQFSKHNLWVLYYNLRIPRFVLLGLSFIIFEAAAICCAVIFNMVVN